jgi:putative ABC transport system permease protein
MFTSVAILTLALAIGANTAIFSLANTLMLRMLPVRAPEQLVELLSVYPGDPRHNGFGLNDYELFRDRNQVFSDLVGMAMARFEVAIDGAVAEAIDGEYVVGSLFPALGVGTSAGRLISPTDDRTGASESAVAVLSWSYWQRRFNGDPAAVGKRIVVSGVPATVIGVAPREFVSLQVGWKPDLWLPVAMQALVKGPGQGAGVPRGLNLIARLKPGVSIVQARAELNVLNRARVEEIAKRSGDPQWLKERIDLEPAGAGFSVLRERFAGPISGVMTIVGLLLALACANIASLLLARGASRQTEMAVRVSLGAGRLRLARQLLAESMLLSGIGGLLGVGIAYLGATALTRVVTSGRILGLPEGFVVDASPDARVLAFTAGVSMLAGLVFGLAPMWSAFARGPAAALRDNAGKGETPGARLFGRGLAAAQVALSLVLLSGAGLFIGHLSDLRHVGTGFQRDSVLLVTLDPRGSGYNRAQLTELYRNLLDRLQTIPGVRSATLSGTTPIEGGAASQFASFPGAPTVGERRRVMMNWVGPRYFETLGTPRIAGRDFVFEDQGRPRVAIVNQAAVRQYLPDGNAIGKRVLFEGDSTPYEIVGVVADAKYQTLQDAAPPTVYLSAFQEGRISSQFAIRTSTAPTAVVEQVRRSVADVSNRLRVGRITTLADQMDASIVPERLIAGLSGLFAVLGTTLAAIGLYGLLAYNVTRRLAEFGVRMALGATAGRILRSVLSNAAGIVAAGMVAGVPIAAWGSRFASSLVVNAPDAPVVPIATAAAVIVGAALLASFVPARRASRVQPADALRDR